MSLWTPYSTETPLDLTPVQSIKREIEPEQPQLDFDTRQDIYARVMYNYPTGYSVPLAQMSPQSFSSSCSGYEHPVPVSPPATPESQRRSYDEADCLSDDPDFQEFERGALSAMAVKNGGSLVGHNPRMRRALASQDRDDGYRKQRTRNNLAAKQSRDRRKLREIHLALKVTYLRNQVDRLKSELSNEVCNHCRRPCDC